MKLFAAFEERAIAGLPLDVGVQIVGSGPRVRPVHLLPADRCPDELCQVELLEGGKVIVTALCGDAIGASNGERGHRIELGPSHSFEVAGWRFALGDEGTRLPRVRFSDDRACPLPTFREKEAPRAHGDEPLALRVWTPDGSHVRELRPPGLTFGRHPDNQLVLDYPMVSRFHGQLLYLAGGWYVEDNRSQNGLSVPGGQLEDGKIRLRAGSVVDVGRLPGAPRLELRYLDDMLNAPPPDDVRLPIVGRSAFAKGLPAELQRLAAIREHLLILGPTGVGKSLVAKCLAALVGREFQTIDCGAIPEKLIESELFGSVKGAFTGAIDHPGPFEKAKGGVVFLDEICELPLDLQTRLLHVLQEREVRRIGGREYVKISCRIVLATHRDPKQMVAEGKLREDLFYRMSRLSMRVPPLRERPEDVKPLAYFTLGLLPVEPRKLLSKAACEKLERHDWPGNVRELENVVAQAAYRTEGREIPAEAVQFDDRPWPSPVLPAGELLGRLPERLRAFQKGEIARTYDHFGHNLTQTARFLGYSPTALRRLLEDFGLLHRKHPPHRTRH